MHPSKPFRMTPQRKLILEELRKDKTHPTADQVYVQVRRRLPRISLATVYRNLELLSEHGLVRRLVSGPGPMRYDGGLAPHFHVRCVVCGAIEDVMLQLDERIDAAAARQTGFEILGHELEFSGICPDCAMHRRSD